MVAVHLDEAERVERDDEGLPLRRPEAAAKACVKLPGGEDSATRNETEPRTRCTLAPETAVTTRARRPVMKMSVTST